LYGSSLLKSSLGKLKRQQSTGGGKQQLTDGKKQQLQMHMCSETTVTARIKSNIKQKYCLINWQSWQHNRKQQTTWAATYLQQATG